MRVESVTWVAERKDVLYVFFFLLSLIYYLPPALKGAGISPFRAGACFVFFICSCLSKGMGVGVRVGLRGWGSLARSPGRSGGHFLVCACPDRRPFPQDQSGVF